MNVASYSIARRACNKCVASVFNVIDDIVKAYRPYVQLNHRNEHNGGIDISGEAVAL